MNNEYSCSMCNKILNIKNKNLILNIKILIFNWNFANYNNATHCGRLESCRWRQCPHRPTVLALAMIQLEVGEWKLDGEQHQQGVAMARQEIKAAGRIRSFILNQNNVVSMPNASKRRHFDEEKN